MSACQRKRISHLSVAEVIFFEALRTLPLTRRGSLCWTPVIMELVI
jgi:hypothetical protein